VGLCLWALDSMAPPCRLTEEDYKHRLQATSAYPITIESECGVEDFAETAMATVSAPLEGENEYGVEWQRRQRRGSM
jgi:hypothetical protein